MGLTRSFVAIEMPEPTAARLSELIRGLQAGRRVPEEDLHLTLAFLGDVSEEGLADLDDALASVRSPPVDIAFTELGHFGARAPRGLHVGVADTPPLRALQAGVQRAVRKAGLQIERRRFVPHVTLARFSGHPENAAALARFLPRAPRPEVPGFKASDFALVASNLHPAGARYAPLARYPLVG